MRASERFILYICLAFQSSSQCILSSFRNHVIRYPTQRVLRLLPMFTVQQPHVMGIHDSFQLQSAGSVPILTNASAFSKLLPQTIPQIVLIYIRYSISSLTTQQTTQQTTIQYRHFTMATIDECRKSILGRIRSSSISIQELIQ